MIDINDYSIKITKIKSLLRGMTFEDFLVYGKIYNYNKTKYRKFKFVLSIDDDAVFEYYEKDKVTKSEIKCFRDDLISGGFTSFINNYNDTDEFYKVCTDSIRSYNESISKKYGYLY